MTPRLVVAIAAAILLAALAALWVAAGIATRRFRRAFESEKAELLRTARARPASGPSGAPTGLPAPVQRYLEVTRASSRSPIRTAILKQKGTIRTAPGQPWMPFESEQVYSLEPPGFVWLARARLAPLVHMMAKDEFLGGKGNMLIKVMGWLTVADARGPTIDQGAGLRYWGEVLAFPETVTSPYLRWEAMDDRHARLIVEQEGLTLTATIEFDAQGYLVATHGERYRDVAGRPALTPWSGYSREWKSFEGRPFPSRWEAVWHLPEGDFLGVRMEVESVLDVTASPL